MRKRIDRYQSFVSGSMAVSRPVRSPREIEYRLGLARDLSRTLYGMDGHKAHCIAWLPLMDVALDGLEGVEIALSRDWSKAA